MRREVSALIEQARSTGAIKDDAARLASNAIYMDREDALLANRLVCQGADPASLELVLRGAISEPVMHAHREGPGSLSIDDRRRWLVLASKSWDEAVEGSVADKVRHFISSIEWLRSATNEQKEAAAAEELHRILDLPYEIEAVAGVVCRVYRNDSGFASAYWSGHAYAAVRTQAGDILIGSSDVPLADHGFDMSGLKVKSPTFAILEAKE
jgi:hypothetical protein